MLNLLLDIAPLPHDYHRDIPRVVTDTIDTLRTIGQEVSDNVLSGGGGCHSTPYILAAILAALVGLGFLIFMVRSYRRRGDQQAGFDTVRS